MSQPSNWGKVELIIFKYHFPIQPRGYSAINLATQILNDYKDKLTEDEKNFLERLVTSQLKTIF